MGENGSAGTREEGSCCKYGCMIYDNMSVSVCCSELSLLHKLMKITGMFDRLLSICYLSIKYFKTVLE